MSKDQIVGTEERHRKMAQIAKVWAQIRVFRPDNQRGCIAALRDGQEKRLQYRQGGERGQ